MELVLRDTQGTLTVSETVFNSSFNEALIHQIITAYFAGSYQGSRAQKTRAEVTGSGRKPWRQKGTGRTRAGSIKSPIWRSGGVTFAAHPRDHSQKVNKKMYRGAMKSIFSKLIRQERLIVVEKFYVEKPKTRLLIRKLKDMLLKEALIIINESDENLFLAARNLHKIEVLNINNINPISLVVHKNIIITTDAIKKIEKMLI